MERKRSERRKHRVLAVVRRRQKFSPRHRPPSRGCRDSQNWISSRRSLPSLTYSVWWRSMHAISSYRGNRPTNKYTHTHATHPPQTGPITIHCASKLSAQCKMPLHKHLKWSGQLSTRVIHLPRPLTFVLCSNRNKPKGNSTRHLPMQEVWRLVEHCVVLLHKLTSNTLRTWLHHHCSTSTNTTRKIPTHSATNDSSCLIMFMLA